MSLLERPGGRRALFTALYLSEGAPIGFIWWALPAWLRSEGIPVERITGLTALLVLPWVLKVLWAPLVDTLRGPRWGLRAWIVSAQLLMGLALLPLVWLDPAGHFDAWRLLLVAHAFAAATQDVAIDALVIRSVPVQERGLLNGSMQAGMLLGRSAFGGGALFLASRLGWSWIVAALIACIWTALGLAWWAREPADRREADGGARGFAAHARRALRLRATWLGLGFALVAGAGFEATGALAGPYLIDRGIGAEAVGLFYGLPVVAATLVGGLVGGRIADALGPRPVVAAGVAGWSTFIAGLALADLGLGTALPDWLPLALLTGMYFFVGAFTASSYALFMDLTDPALGATQFSAYMAATNGCESWAAWTGGRVTARLGYAPAFLGLTLVSLASLWLLRARSLRGPGAPSSGQAPGSTAPSR